MAFPHDKMEVYVINLDRSPERLERMKRRLGKLGIPFVRIAGADGKSRPFVAGKDYSPKKYSLAAGKQTTPTEIGCYISHYTVMEKFLRSSAKPFALIIEDDMAFSDDLPDILAALAARPGWDMVKLNGSHRGGYVCKRSLTPRYRLAKNLFHQSKSGAYVINRRAAERYVAKLLPMFVPLDHEFVKFWKYGLRGFCLTPFPAREEGADTTIDYKALRLTRKPWWKRLPTALYKSWIALRRAFYVAFDI